MDENVIREFMVRIGYASDETSLKKFTASLASVTKMVMGLGAAIVATAGAVVAGVKIISGEMERLYYASQRTGETVGNLMALRYAAGQIGLTADQAQTSLEGFTRTLRLNPGMSGLLQQLGVTGNGPLEQFQSFIGKMKQMQPYIAAQYAGLFGIDPDTLLMLENGLPKIQAAQDRYRAKLGAFGINPEQAAQAGTDFDNSIRDLIADVHLFWVLLQEHLAPVLQTIVAQFEKWEAGNADKVAQKIATALEAVAKWVSEINWDDVGKNVDVFLAKAWEVAKVIGNIVNGIIRIGGMFGLSDGRTPGKDDPPDARSDDSAFISWVRRKRWSLQKLFSGGDEHPELSPGESVESGPTGRAPRGIRNNNPGNIRYGDFARSAGATGADSGGFAIFGDMETGVAATRKLLASYAARGYNTIRKIVSRWAPANENDTQAYIAAVAKQLGVSADATLTGNQLGGVAGSIFQHENGSAYGKLGVGAAAGASRNVTIQQKTDIHVNGSSDPHGTARTVLGEQGRVNGDMVRNFAGAVQ